MGGGDLNTKKAWHPSNLKNQERVWKAEQAVAAEKKRMVELERERAQERDREELNSLSRQNPHTSSAPHDNRLHWMYDKPDKQVQQEDYLLGKAIDKNYEQGDKPDQNEIPAVSRRVVGSSMITAGGDVQVDLVRKLREDPLLLVKERERAARAALLNNPIQRRRLAEMLRKEQELKNQHKKEKSKKSNLDDLLASKLNALGGEKTMNLAKLLDSDSSSSDSSVEIKAKKKKKKKKMKKQKQKKQRDSSPDESLDKSKKSKDKKKQKERKSNHDDSDSEMYSKKEKSHNNYKHDDNKCSSLYKRKNTLESDTEPNTKSRKNHREESSPHHQQPDRHDRYPKSYWEYSSDRKRSRREEEPYNRNQFKDDRRETSRSGLSQEEKAARLAAMAAAGAEREVQRGRRVAQQLAEKAAAETVSNVPRSSSTRNEARILPDSLESRIHSNRHNIQRDKRHMNEHFARR